MTTLRRATLSRPTGAHSARKWLCASALLLTSGCALLHADTYTPEQIALGQFY